MDSSAISTAAIFLLLGALGSSAAWWVFFHGYSFYYGDAEAHLNIARRIFDSRTPGPEQIGTVWLPLPHILLALFTRVDALWFSGLAGVIPSVACFTLAGTFLFLAAHRVYGSTAAAVTVALLFTLNPNMLYLAATPMTEPVMAAALAALLWATLWFRDSQSLWALLAAAAACNAASLTRYEGWFVIPFVALYIWIVARNKTHAFLFGILAMLGPCAWLAHNLFYYNNALEFYNGPYSAQAIFQRQLSQGMPQPGTKSWTLAAFYYWSAARHVVGDPLLILGSIGLVAALWRRAWWAVALLCLPAIFYIWSMHSSGTPIFVPELEPFTRYNTRYALLVLPLAAFAAGALVVLFPESFRSKAAIGLTLVGAILLAARPVSICWEEAEAGSAGRRAYTQEAAAFLKDQYKHGAGIVFWFGDLAGILRQAGIPIREGLYQDNGSVWKEALAQPVKFKEEWVLTLAGDPVSEALQHNDSAYQLVHRVEKKGAPAVEIFRRH
ncbi:MAG: hypothetical protein ABI811_14190 [Acidobacteriota bacterium]